MSFLNMLSWWQWTLLAAVPPAIVLLYFLKLRRTPLQVPSTFLWHKSIEDLHANSIWQRLRQNLLLLLQLLLLALAMLALLRPGWSGSHLAGNRLVLLIDTSASMSATDVRPTRLAEAKQRARALIDQMASGDTAMLISFSDTARIEQSFTDNQRDLHRQLDAIEPTDRPTSIAEALRLAAGLARTEPTGTEDEGRASTPPAALYILSDGNFASQPEIELNHLRPVYVPIGQAESENIAITAFHTQRPDARKEKLQAFARLQNFGPRDQTVEVELFRDGNLIDAGKVALAAQGAGGIAFDLGDMHQGVLRLSARVRDDLKMDNEAWAALDPPHRQNVLLVTPGNDALELALATARAREIADIQIARPEVLETPDYQQRAAAGDYSLVIYDQCQPRTLPQSNTLFIGRLPPGTAWTADAMATAPTVIDLDATHPLTEMLDLGNVRFAEAAPLKPPAGGRALITADVGILLAIAPRDGFEDAVLSPEIVGGADTGEHYANTDWPLRLSFPVFALNALTYLSGAEESGETNLGPGHILRLRPSGSSGELVVRSPNGKTATLARSASGSLDFAATDTLGVYEVLEPQHPPRHFTVNLFSPTESNLKPRLDIQLGYEELNGQAGWEGTRRELWKPLLLGALGVLCLEWYIYTRRTSF